MINQAKWIWLNCLKYPNEQKSEMYFSKAFSNKPCRFVEFEKKFNFDKQIKKVEIEISADVKYFLYLNGKYIGVGPVTPGGDYNSVLPMPHQYYSAYETVVNDTQICIYALVQTQPIVQCDMTQGRNGFICACKIYFSDGSMQNVYSDETWFCRVAASYEKYNVINQSNKQNGWDFAEIIKSEWNLLPSEILNTVEDKINPIGLRDIIVKAGESITSHYELEKIYSGYYSFFVQAEDKYRIDIYDYEKDKEKSECCFTVEGNKNGYFRSVALTSAGAFDIKITSLGESEIRVTDIVFLFQHYPCLSLGGFECNDEKLNEIYNMGRHALKICRQSIELDSPKHQENLQCIGDYHIASLMNYYSDGDTRLTRFDIMRIARYLEVSNGYMFHTTFGLIWVQMVYQYYLHTGDVAILSFVKNALFKLLEYHNATANVNGIIDKPLNYMFVDWIDVDGYTMHHPPKALGQTVLNAFYYEALQKATVICGIIGEDNSKKIFSARAKKLKKSFSVFYDENRGLYFDGLNDYEKESEWLPRNTEKRYYSWHSNTLAVLYDLAPVSKQRSIIEKMLNENGLITPQPYFMHFVLEAVYKVGLFEKYGMLQLNRWKYMTEFGKGLVEGWEKCEAYGYDYSHVWAGTPTYQLPGKLSGIKILKAGYEEVLLKPRLFGLKWARIKIPTPKGVILIDMHKGKDNCIQVPEGIKCTVK